MKSKAKTKKPGRPAKEPTAIIAVPVDCIPAVEKILGRSIAENQIPIVKIRVPNSDVDKVRKAIKKVKS